MKIFISIILFIFLLGCAPIKKEQEKITYNITVKNISGTTVKSFICVDAYDIGKDMRGDYILLITRGVKTTKCVYPSLYSIETE